MIALMGTFLGFVLAVAASWGIISAIPADRPIPLAVPPVQLSVIVVLASVASWLRWALPVGRPSSTSWRQSPATDPARGVQKGRRHS